jgi:hypothetical protein
LVLRSSRQHSEIPRGPPSASHYERVEIPAGNLVSRLAQSLPPGFRKDYVFRVAVFLVAMTLSIGQAPALLCGAWCQPQTAAASDCHQRQSGDSERVTGSHGCGDVALGAAVVREDLLRSASISVTHNAVTAARYQLGPAPADAEPDRDALWRSPLHQPLATPLRL